GSVGAAAGDVKRSLLDGAGGEHGVEVADEEEALGAAAGLLGHQVIAVSLLGDPRDREAERLQPLGQDGADPVHVEDVVGAAVVIHEAREELDLLVPPAVESRDEVAHASDSLWKRRCRDATLRLRAASTTAPHPARLERSVAC